MTETKVDEIDQLKKSAKWLGIGAGVVCLAFAGATVTAEATYNANQAETFLEHQGYRSANLESTERGPVSLYGYGCESLDEVVYKFHALSADNREVNVAVCRGLFKVSTIHELQP